MKKVNKKRKSKRRRKSTGEQFHRRCGAIVELTDAFCSAYLNEDYVELCREVVDELRVGGFPLDKGRAASWAGGIVHALGWVNFLDDPSMSPHMSSAEIAEGFGLSQGTITAKSKLIRDELDLIPLDPEWCTAAMLEHNPLIWMMEVNGFITDIRLAPREIQEEAYLQGLIPYIPDDMHEPPLKSDGGPGATILTFPSHRTKTAGPESPDESEEDTAGLFD